MITLGVAAILYELANKLEFTGGADGLQGGPSRRCWDVSNSISTAASPSPTRWWCSSSGC